MNFFLFFYFYETIHSFAATFYFIYVLFNKKFGNNGDV